MPPTVNESEINHLIITIHHRPKGSTGQAHSLTSVHKYSNGHHHTPKHPWTWGLPASLLRLFPERTQMEHGFQSGWRFCCGVAKSTSTLAGGSVTNWPGTRFVQKPKVRAEIHCTCHASQRFTPESVSTSRPSVVVSRLLSSITEVRKNPDFHLSP